MLIFIILLFLPLFAFGQQPWKNYTKDNSGLPTNSVHVITFDTSGAKWIGTWGGGLVKFDDTTWTTFDTTNSPLPHNNIYSLLIDKNNTKWIGTFGGGLAKFNDTTWTVYNTHNSGLTDNTIYSMVFDEDENIYISTWGRAFLKFDRKNMWTNFNRPGSLFYNKKVPSMFYVSRDSLWVGGVNGLYLLNNDNVINFGDWDHNFAQSVYSIARGKDNILWVGFKTGGIAQLTNDKWYFIDYLNSYLPSNTVYNLSVDNNNNLWISTFGTGLAKLSGNDWTIYNKSNSPLTDDFIFSTSQDKDGRIWICTLTGGIFVKFIND